MHRLSFLAVAAGLVLAPVAPATAQTPDSADVAFAQGMMHHHAQAIVMSRMASSRTSRSDLRTAARKIIVSQRDEIAMMRHWLERRHQTVPVIDTVADTASRAMAGMQMRDDDSSAHHLMPGMLTADELHRLSRAHGAKFDSLYLKYMIAHHKGALTMVAKLFSTSGATDDPEIAQLASEIDADQAAEIARMQSMQAHPPKNRKK